MMWMMMQGGSVQWMMWMMMVRPAVQCAAGSRERWSGSLAMAGNGPLRCWQAEISRTLISDGNGNDNDNGAGGGGDGCVATC